MSASRLTILATAASCALWTSSIYSPSLAQSYVVKPVVEKKIDKLPPGPLYWRLETMTTLTEAETAANRSRWNPDTVSADQSTSLAAEIAGKVWLFTLDAPGGSTPGATKIGEVGPLPEVKASQYLLRVNHGSGPPGSMTPVHTHPGSEAFYVVAGRLGQRTPAGVQHVDAGSFMNGHPAETKMQVFNSGDTDLTAIIMFVVDANKPFSTPAKFD